MRGDEDKHQEYLMSPNHHLLHRGEWEIAIAVPYLLCCFLYKETDKICTVLYLTKHHSFHLKILLALVSLI